MTNEVRDFYDRFPYPLATVKSAYDLRGAAILRLLDFELRAARPANRRILDVGCGTGHRILDVARSYPDAHIRAFDLSRKSIDLARRQAQQDGICNITFEVGDITRFECEERFDIVIANGVLHHLADPHSAARRLSGLVNDTGFLYAFLVHSYGEHEKLLQRDLLLTLLGAQRSSHDAGLALLRDMGYGITSGRYGERLSEDLDAVDMLSRDADSLLNPIHAALKFDEALELLCGTGLDWAEIDRVFWEGGGAALDLAGSSSLPFPVFTLDGRLDSRLARDYYERLDTAAKLHVVELLAKPTGFLLLAGTQRSVLLSSKRIVGNAIALSADAS